MSLTPTTLTLLRDLVFALEVTETCLKTWNHYGSPCNVEGILERARASIREAEECSPQPL